MVNLQIYISKKGKKTLIDIVSLNSNDKLDKKTKDSSKKDLSVPKVHILCFYLKTIISLELRKQFEY